MKNVKKRKFVPIEKQSKRKQKEHYQTERNSWDIHPATRKLPNLKLYNRKKSKAWHEPLDFFVLKLWDSVPHLSTYLWTLPHKSTKYLNNFFQTNLTTGVKYVA